MARLLSQEGWQVHSISRRPCDVPGVSSHLFDLAEPPQAHAAAAQIIQSLGRFSGLSATGGGSKFTVVHNASTHFEDSVLDLDSEKMTAALAVSAVSPAILTSALLPHMGPGSSVIFVGSTLSEKAVAGRSSYVTAKHATLGLMRT